jgi:hypothetical protein
MIQHLFRQLVHPEQLIDCEVGEFARLGVVFDTAADELETIPERRNRVADLVCELRHQPARGREPIALHEVRLQRGESGVAIGQRRVRTREIGESSGEHTTHLIDCVGNLLHLDDS